MNNAKLLAALATASIVFPACSSTSPTGSDAHAQVSAGLAANRLSEDGSHDAAPALAATGSSGDAPRPDARARGDDVIPGGLVMTTARNATAAPAAEGRRWEFGLAPYVWGTAVKGRGTIQGVSGEVDASFGDIFGKTELGLMIAAEARTGDTIIRLDQDYLATEDGTNVPGARVKVKGQLYVATFTAGHVIGEGSEAPEVFAGARYWGLDASATVKVGGTSVARGSGTKSWVDPVIGARKRWELGGPWGLVAMGTTGGFGVGTSSESSWGAALLASRTAQSGSQLLFGWRHLAVRYNRGSGADEFKFNMRFTGPIMGWAFRF